MPTLRRARLLQFLGLLLALSGLIGFWWTRDADRTELGAQQRELLGIEEGEFHASFVVAGRDIDYSDGRADPIYAQNGDIVGWDFHGVSSVRGGRTDTILYLSIVDTTLTMVAIPRDLFVGEGTQRINGVFSRDGPDGLVRRVESILGLPIDYHAIVDLNIFQGMVDALGGVEVNVPERMYYRDVAGGLTIDFQPGPQVLDGKAASEFIRYRQTQRGDIDRLDNVKRLAYAMLAKLKSLNVRAVGAVPDLAATFFEQVDTNASPALVRRMLPRIADLDIRSATLPTIEVRRGEAAGLVTEPAVVETFLADTFGGTARAFRDAPDALLLISDRSGEDGLGDWYRDRLVGLGVPADRVRVRQDSYDPSGTRIVAISRAWSDADYYAELLGTGKQQVDHLDSYRGEPVQMELVLGGDARGMVPLAAAHAVSDASPPREEP